MRFVDGARVSYIGEPDHGLEFEDVGKVLLAEATGSHVQWKTGTLTEQITLVPNHLLVPVSARSVQRSVLDDSLDEGGFFNPGTVTSAFNAFGSLGVRDMLEDEGHLATLHEVGIEEVVQGLMAKVRQDASVREAVGQLGDEDGEVVIVAVARHLLKQALQELAA